MGVIIRELILYSIITEIYYKNFSTKYQIFNNILSEDRKELFCSHTYCRNNANYDYLLELVLGREAIDPDNNIILVRFNYNKFEEYRQFVMFMQYSMMNIFNNYNQYSVCMSIDAK